MRARMLLGSAPSETEPGHQDVPEPILLILLILTILFQLLWFVLPRALSFLPSCSRAAALVVNLVYRAFRISSERSILRACMKR